MEWYPGSPSNTSPNPTGMLCFHSPPCPTQNPTKEFRICLYAPCRRMWLHLIASQTVILENDLPQQIEFWARHKRKLSNDILNDIEENKAGFKIVFEYC